MLDEAKPEAVFVTTANDRHLEILRECAKRHIHYSTEKPMATNAAEAREMQRLADQAGIKLMVNYWNAWTASSHDLFHRVKAGEIGPVQKIIIVQYGHQGPKEIGVSKEFADWLYDPVRTVAEPSWISDATAPNGRSGSRGVQREFMRQRESSKPVSTTTWMTTPPSFSTTPMRRWLWKPHGIGPTTWIGHTFSARRAACLQGVATYSSALRPIRRLNLRPKASRLRSVRFRTRRAIL